MFLKGGILIYLYSYLEEAIRKIYYHLGISTPGQIDEYVIAEKLGVEILFYDESSEALSHEGIHRIFLNEYLTKQQKWQDFSHELCHVLRHAGYQFDMPFLFRELQEWQADSFMYHFCVPTFMLVQLEMPQHMNEATWMIAEVFNVEVEFARKRLDMWLNKRESFLYSQKVAETSLFYEWRN